jgi:outer membrane protein
MRRGALSLIALALGYLPLAAQEKGPPPWSFRTRAIITGNSAESEPAGYKMYSAITLEAALTRRLGRLFGLELGVRTESREVDFQPGEEPAERLGSLELLPVNLLLQVRPALSGRFHPYAGAGLNLTVAWEKSGVLDSMDVSPSPGAALQLGADLDLSPAILLNFDLRWNALSVDIENRSVPYASLKVDPIALGLGLGFRF